jgi:hypothetical protein
MKRNQHAKLRRIAGYAAATALVASVVLATPPIAAQQPDPQGFIYGRVSTETGSTFEGRLRWGNHEAFWNDFFNSVKKERQLPNEAKDKLRKKEKIKVFGITVAVRYEDLASSRLFKARFGDIREIRVRGDDKATVVMKSGTEFRVEGGSTDIGAKVQIWDRGLGKVDVEWDRIETVQFLPTPKGLEVDVHRLFGPVQTTVGDFHGFVQWDQDEGLSTDKLDGDSKDADMSIELGRIRSIERESRSSAEITLLDDRKFVLDDSNDVDSSNRGILVADDRYGHVLVSWGEFERVDFSVPENNGPTYESFEAGKPLEGTVTDRDGTTHEGRLIYDLDEAESWELFDGNMRDIEYSIPMSKIATVVPWSRDSSRVTLRNGEELELEGTADAGDGNAGVLVLNGDSEQTYLPWDEIRRIEFK